MVTMFVRVRHKLHAPVMCFILPCSMHSCSLVAWYLEIRLKKKQIASNECVYQGNILYVVS